jgi:hypothetical protein
MGKFENAKNNQTEKIAKMILDSMVYFLKQNKKHLFQQEVEQCLNF